MIDLSKEGAKQLAAFIVWLEVKRESLSKCDEILAAKLEIEAAGLGLVLCVSYWSDAIRKEARLYFRDDARLADAISSALFIINGWLEEARLKAQDDLAEEYVEAGEIIQEATKLRGNHAEQMIIDGPPICYTYTGPIPAPYFFSTEPGPEHKERTRLKAGGIIQELAGNYYRNDYKQAGPMFRRNPAKGKEHFSLGEAPLSCSDFIPPAGFTEIKANSEITDEEGDLDKGVVADLIKRGQEHKKIYKYTGPLPGPFFFSTDPDFKAPIKIINEGDEIEIINGYYYLCRNFPAGPMYYAINPATPRGAELVESLRGRLGNGFTIQYKGGE